MKNETEIMLWADKLGIFKNSNPFSQFEKMKEEVGELDAALKDTQENEDPLSAEELLQEVKLELGDVFVTGIILAAMHGWTIEEVMDDVFDKIKGRTGKMVDGIFVKDSY